MALNILDAAKNFLTPGLLSKAASYLGESESSISKALGGLIPASLLGITEKASSSGGASTVLDLARQASNSDVFGNLEAAFQPHGEGIPKGVPGILSTIFGDKAGGMANLIAQFSGIKGASAASLVGSVVPFLLGLVGKHANENGLSAAGLSSWLQTQKSSFLNALPAGLNVSNLFASGHSAPVDHHKTASSTTTTSSWLMPLILGLAAVALLLYIFKGCGVNKHQEPEHVQTSSTPEPAPVNTPVTPNRELLKVKLPDGTEIDAYKGGIEDKLVTCLNNVACQPGKDQWFDFDNINFNTASAQLTNESAVQIRNIVVILKAYPKAKIKIGGYTDKVGDDAANKILSQERAASVLAEIEKAGGNTAQLAGAEGYGEEFAKIEETASDEERRSDRRISIQLREK